MINKKKKLIEISLIFLVMTIGLVQAVAISSFYSYQRPLNMYPGETKEISITLQNMAGDSDLRFETEIAEGFEIASIDKKQYDVPVGNNNVNVGIEIKIPKETSIGEEFIVFATFRPVSLEEEEGMVQIATALSQHIKVNIIEKPEGVEEGMNIIPILLWAIVIVIIAIIVYVIIKKRKPPVKR